MKDLSAQPPIVLDTDLGSDVDDLLALVVLVRLAPRRLRAITTVYGDTALRARLAACACTLLGAEGVTISAGAELPLSGLGVWGTREEGRGWPLNGQEAFRDRRTAPGPLLEVLDECDRPPQLIAIGPLTNLALALEADPQLHRRVDRVFVMGGFFGGRRPEHNFRADADAAARVFGSELEITVCGLEVTLRAWLGEADVARLEACEGRVERLVASEARRWWSLSSEWISGDSPHDAVCVLAALQPSLFVTDPATITVSRDGPQPGVSAARLHTDGRHQLVTGVAAETVDATIVHTLLGR